MTCKIESKIALTRNLEIMTMCLFGLPCTHTCLHMKAQVRISYVRTEACLLERCRQGRKSGGQGRGTGCFEEADPDRDHCGEAGDWRIRIRGQLDLNEPATDGFQRELSKPRDQSIITPHTNLNYIKTIISCLCIISKFMTMFSFLQVS